MDFALGAVFYVLSVIIFLIAFCRGEEKGRKKLILVFCCFSWFLLVFGYLACSFIRIFTYVDEKDDFYVTPHILYKLKSWE
jgi:hypothetical protein